MEEEGKDLPCAGKLAFDNKKAAKASAVVAKFQHGRTFGVYRCQHCGLWHLNSVYQT